MPKTKTELSQKIKSIIAIYNSIFILTLCMDWMSINLKDIV